MRDTDAKGVRALGDGGAHGPDAGAGQTSARSSRRGFRDRYLRRNRTTHLVYRSVVGVVGTLVVVTGVALLPLPGPGWLIIFAGLAILASEFAWAARLLAWARQQVTAWTRWVGRRSVVVRGVLALGAVALVAVGVLAYESVVGLPDWVPGALADPIASFAP